MQRKSIRIPGGEKQKDPIVIEITESMEIDVQVGNDASVFVLCLQADASTKPLHIVQKGTVGARAALHWCNVTLGGNITQELVSECVGDHAESSVDWIFSARGKARQKISARNVFSARSGGGEITMKGVAEGTARTVCHGMIEIAEGGTGTDTYLTEDVLMLDATAQIDAVPGLEIRTNDVKASHSATVSRVTPEDLFYFQSRGIDKDTARTMYIEGFLSELLERIPEEGVRERVREGLLMA